MEKKYKTPTNLADKLKAYSALTAVAISSSANAAIQYTDVNPDLTFSTNGDFYDLDLNNDNVVDFRIDLFSMQGTSSYYTYDFRFVAITPQLNNAVSASYYSSSFYPYALNPNQTIGPSGNFASTSTSMLMGGEVNIIYGTNTYNRTGGNFLGQTDKYLGLRIQVGANTHYGWARVDVSANGGSFTIKDYAFESTPNTPIVTGITVGIQNQDISKLIKANIFNKSLILSVSDTRLIGNEIQVLDMKGNSVHTSLLGSNEQTIELSHLSSGMYIVDLRTSEGVFRKKIMLEN